MLCSVSGHSRLRKELCIRTNNEKTEPNIVDDSCLNSCNQSNVKHEVKARTSGWRERNSTALQKMITVHGHGGGKTRGLKNHKILGSGGGS